MTSPQPLPSGQQAPQQPGSHVLLAVTALLAAGYTAEQLAARLLPLLSPLGISPQALVAAVRLATWTSTHRVSREIAVRVAVTAPDVPRTATSRAVPGEAGMRARYLLAAAERLSKARTREEFAKALQDEQRYRQQHLDAQTRRLTAAGRVDLAAQAYGVVLGWNTRRDDRVTPDCAVLDGANFRADRQPRSGWPGALHGGTCRCYAGPPHATSRRVP